MALMIVREKEECRKIKEIVKEQKKQRKGKYRNLKKNK